METNNALKIKFRYKVSDIIQGYHFYKSKSKFKIIRLLFAVSVFLYMLWIYSLVGFQWYVLIVAIIGLDVYFDFIGTLRCYYSYKANSTLYGQPFEFIVDESEGISVKTKTYQAQRSWSGYQHYLENEKMFLLVSGKGLYTPYPKSAFSSHEDLKRFRKIIKKKIAKGR